MKKNILKIILTIIVFVLIFKFFELLLMPKYILEAQEGRLIAEYYNDNHQNQVIFIGDCEVYENFSPITLWEEYGITSYIRGGPQQLIWQSYYLLEETLKYETPDVVVFNVLSMKYGEPQSEAYNRLNIDGMKFSTSKIGAITSSMTDEESFASYIFPLLRYHDRIASFTIDDFKYMFNDKELSYNGYLLQTGVKPVTTIPKGDLLSDYNLPDNSFKYLDMITELCKENDIELILIKAPSIYPHWYEEWDEQINEYAQNNNLSYYNFLDNIEEIGIDFDVDTYDAGLHLNVWGAEKLTSYFGEILSNTNNLENQKNNQELVDIWSEKSLKYNEEKNN